MRADRLIHRVITFIAASVAIFVVGSTANAAPRTTNDPYLDRLWYLDHIGALEAWNTSLGLESIPVAIIDSGVDIDHPDLKDNIWRNHKETPNDRIDNDGNGYIDDVFGWDFVSNDNDPNPERGSGDASGASHGTISAGVVSAKGDNSAGVVGVTWQAPIMAIRALDANGSGDALKVARAVDYAVDNGAKVINLSFAGSVENGRLADSLRRAYDRGVFVVAAAGNAPEGGSATDLDVEGKFPVCFDLEADENYVYGVAATDRNDVLASFSNYGAGCVDIAAPGTRIISTQLYDPDDPRFSQPYGGYFEGTSVAAPIVAGVVALMRAVDPLLTPKQLMNIITETAVNIDERNPGLFGKVGRGRIDAARAVQRAATARTPAVPVAPVLITSSLLPPGETSLVVAVPGAGRDAEARMFTNDGLYVRAFDAFPKGYRGGVSLAAGNFDGNARSSIVVAPLGGGAPQVRIFDVNTRNIGGFMAYDERFTGGVEVAAGDLTGDGIDEIVTGAGPGGGPHVRVFDKHGRDIAGFFAFEDSYRGGIDVAVGDVNSDGRHEIIAADARGTVRVFDLHGRQLDAFVLTNTGRTRLLIDVTDTDGDGTDEVVVRSYDRSIAPRAYTAKGVLVSDLSLSAHSLGSPSGDAPRAYGTAASGFLAYEEKFLGGVRTVAVELTR